MPDIDWICVASGTAPSMAHAANLCVRPEFHQQGESFFSLLSFSFSMASVQQALSLVDGVSYKDYVLGFSCAVYAFEQYLK